MTPYQPRHFIVQEFVPPELYKALGARSIFVMDYYIVKMADAIREYFGLPMTINNWKWGGKFKYRGFRPCECKVGAKYSLHRTGKAIDFDIAGVSAEEVRQEILNHPRLFPHIAALEKGVSWVHADCRCITDGPILF